jgi:hypothetical protein
LYFTILKWRTQKARGKVSLVSGVKEFESSSDDEEYDEYVPE